MPVIYLYAVLSDIHANYEALLAVAEDAGKIARDPSSNFHDLRYICLGDTVDRGPQPNECMAWLAQVEPAVVLRGNHDDDVSKPNKYDRPGRVDKLLWPMTLWTRCRLDAQHRATIRGYTESACGPNGLGKFTLFHSDPGGQDNYLDSAAQTRPVFEKLTQADYGLFGHTHFQMWFTWDGSNVQVIYAQPEGVQEDETHKCVNTWHHVNNRVSLLNPGSVGQPGFHLSQLSGDPRAAYMLLYNDPQKGVVFQWRRVKYAHEKTAALLRNLEWPKDKDILKDALPGAGTDQESSNGVHERERMSKEEFEQYAQKLPELRKRLAAAIA